MGLLNWAIRPKLPPTANLSLSLKSYINAVKQNKNAANISNVKNKMNAFILAAKGTAAAVPIPRGNSNFDLTQSYTNLKNAINAANKSKLKNLSNAVNQAISSYNAQANNNKKLPASLVNNAKKSVAKARALNSASENVLSAAKEFMNKARAYKNVNIKNINAYNANLKAKYNKLPNNLKNLFKNNYNTLKLKPTTGNMSNKTLEKRNNQGLTSSNRKNLQRTEQVNFNYINTLIKNKNNNSAAQAIINYNPGIFKKNNNGSRPLYNKFKMSATNVNRQNIMRILNLARNKYNANPVEVARPATNMKGTGKALQNLFKQN
jgi:hypothetical protein